MAVTSVPIFPQTIKSPVQQILQADTSSKKTLYAAGVNGSRVESIVVTSTDTVLRLLQFYVTVSGTDYLIASIQCDLSAGTTTAIPPLSVFSSVNMAWMSFDPAGNRYLYLESGAALKVASTTTLTATKAIQFFVQGGDY